MKKVLIASAVAGLAMSGPTLAGGKGFFNSLQNGGAYSIGVGMADVSDHKESAIVLTGSYEKSLGALVPGLSVGIGAASSVSDSEEPELDITGSYWAVDAYLKYSQSLEWFVQDLSANAKVGHAYSDFEFQVDGETVSKGTDKDLVLGAGFSYAMDDHTSFTTDYTAYKTVDQITIGLHYVF